MVSSNMLSVQSIIKHLVDPGKARDDSKDPPLSEIAEDFLKTVEFGSAIEKQWADFVNSQWSKKLSDSKLYISRRNIYESNCEPLTTAQVNTEI